jgi:hypothetical protein
MTQRHRRGDRGTHAHREPGERGDQKQAGAMARPRNIGHGVRRGLQHHLHGDHRDDGIGRLRGKIQEQPGQRLAAQDPARDREPGAIGDRHGREGDRKGQARRHPRPDDFIHPVWVQGHAGGRPVGRVSSRLIEG